MRPACLIFWITAVALAAGNDGAQERFASPADAANALVQALRTNDLDLFVSITGQDFDRLMGSGDPERDAWDRKFLVEDARRVRFESAVRDAQVLHLYAGNAREPFPAPLVKTPSGWYFDGESGLKIAARSRIQRNELAAIELCHRYFEAQMAYSTSDAGDGGPVFAQRIRSTSGKRDGLYWSIESGEPESPIGPLFAAAAFAEQPNGVSPVPYFGYYFRMLPASDPAAHGFSLVAWPAVYQVTGVRSFLINDRNEVCATDLGIDPAPAAVKVSSFRCDGGWRRVTEGAGGN